MASDAHMLSRKAQVLVLSEINILIQHIRSSQGKIITIKMVLVKVIVIMTRMIMIVLVNIDSNYVYIAIHDVKGVEGNTYVHNLMWNTKNKTIFKPQPRCCCPQAALQHPAGHLFLHHKLSCYTFLQQFLMKDKIQSLVIS